MAGKQTLATASDVLADLTQLARKGVISYVLPAVPFGEGFTVGTSFGPVALSHDSATSFVLWTVQAGVWQSQVN